MDLSTLLDQLADQEKVFARSGENTGADIGEHVLELVRVADAAWDEWIDPRGAFPLPRSAAEAMGRLDRVDSATAADMMARYAAYDLAYTSAELRDPATARDTARQVVALLGENAHWWCNETSITGDDHVCKPVTRCTLDGMVAGMSDTHFVVLLQVAED